MITKGDAVKKVADFVVKNKEVPRENRPELVRKFTDELLDAGVSNVHLQTWTMRMPALMWKGLAGRFSILEVLAEYVLNIDQVAERSEEFPIKNAEREYRERGKRSDSELSIIFSVEGDPDDKLRGAAYEDNFANTGDPVTDELFSEPPSMSAEELTVKLQAIKDNPKPFVVKYADGSAWSKDNTVKRRTYDNTYEAIRNLDMTRVKECEVCGGGFYAHDRRQIVCNTMPHPRQRSMSFCQYERDKQQAKIRKLFNSEKPLEIAS